MQKGSKPRTRLSSLQDTHRKCVPEQIPVLQSPSTLTSVQHADPCHMQFLIHLDTTENNSPEEEQGGLAKAMNAELALSKPLWHPSARDHRQALTSHPYESDLCLNSACGIDAYLAHRQVQQDGYGLCHSGHQNERLFITLTILED